jgi:hypothetical protein
MKASLALAFFAALLPIAAAAQTQADESSCRAAAPGQHRRQTVVVVDGGIVVPDGPDGPSEANRPWRHFVSLFVDAENPVIQQLVGPAERLTIAIANADGSGLTMLFAGCVPLVDPQEASRLDGETSGVSTFFGTDWRSRQGKLAESFARAARLSLVEGIGRAKIGTAGRQPFAAGGLVRSLAKFRGFALEAGLPRLVVVTDVGLYEFPAGDVVEVRKAARVDAEASGLDLARSELNVFSAGPDATDATAAYLSAFLLAAKAKLETIGGLGGTPSSNKLPMVVDVYQGSVGYPDGDYPIRMRLARDRNGSVVHSWMEVQSDRARFVPFAGLLNCTGPNDCEYVGDRVFAQIWSDKPDPDPECEAWMPFAGLRELSFRIEGDGLSGKITDSGCYVAGKEDGLEFQMKRVPNGVF